MVWSRVLDEDSLVEDWRVSLGPGYSTPIVSADRVFVTETADRKTEIVRALDRKTGKEIWRAQWPGAMSVPFFAKANGDWIRATPAYDGESLFVAGMRDVLVCLDAETGKERWRQDFVKELKTPLPAFGFASSPLVAGDAIYVQAGAGVHKLDKADGKILWSTLDGNGGIYGSAFSSPIIAELAGKPQLVVQTRSTLAGVDLDSGEVLWSRKVEAFRGMNILTPVVYGDHVFTSSYGGGSFLFRISKEGDGFTASQVWRNKLQGYMGSPVVIDGHAYFHLRNQRFACLNLETGREAWISQPFGKYWSLIANNEKILALDERGDLLLIKANPNKFEVIETRHVSDASTWAHLVVCGREVLIRDLKGISAYSWKE